MTHTPRGDWAANDGGTMTKQTIEQTRCDDCGTKTRTPRRWSKIHLGYGNYLDLCPRCSRIAILSHTWPGDLIPLECQQCGAIVCFCGSKS